MKSSNVEANILFCVEYSCKLILVASRPIVQGYTGHKNPHKILEYHSSFTKFLLFLDITVLESITWEKTSRIIQSRQVF